MSLDLVGKFFKRTGGTGNLLLVHVRVAGDFANEVDQVLEGFVGRLVQQVDVLIEGATDGL